MGKEFIRARIDEPLVRETPRRIDSDSQTNPEFELPFKEEKKILPSGNQTSQVSINPVNLKTESKNQQKTESVQPQSPFNFFKPPTQNVPDLFGHLKKDRPETLPNVFPNHPPKTETKDPEQKPTSKPEQQQPKTIEPLPPAIPQSHPQTDETKEANKQFTSNIFANSGPNSLFNGAPNLFVHQTKDSESKTPLFPFDLKNNLFANPKVEPTKAEKPKSEKEHTETKPATINQEPPKVEPQNRSGLFNFPVLGSNSTGNNAKPFFNFPTTSNLFDQPKSSLFPSGGLFPQAHKEEDSEEGGEDDDELDKKSESVNEDEKNMTNCIQVNSDYEKLVSFTFEDLKEGGKDGIGSGLISIEKKKETQETQNEGESKPEKNGSSMENPAEHGAQKTLNFPLLVVKTKAKIVLFVLQIISKVSSCVFLKNNNSCVSLFAYKVEKDENQKSKLTKINLKIKFAEESQAKSFKETFDKLV